MARTLCLLRYDLDVVGHTLRSRFAFGVVVALAAGSGSCQCAGAFALACASTRDCPSGFVCGAGVCTRAGGRDAGSTSDAGSIADAGAGVDAGARVDAGTNADAGGDVDAGGTVDAGPCVDRDGDGVIGPAPGCDAGPHFDCNDADPRVFPGHIEECDGLDNDCNGTVDDHDVCACIPLRVGIAAKNPRLLCLTPRVQAGAEAECERRGYRLAIFHDQTDLDAVKNAFFDSGLHVWNSLHRQTTGSSTFVWGDGSSLDVQEFAGGEPNDNGGNEDCVEMTGGAWNDTNCARALPFLCEPAPPVLDGGVACVDLDHDGRGTGCALGLDCDDNNNDAGMLIGGAEDFDEDGFTSDVRDLFCTDGTLVDGLLPEATTTRDCDDQDENNHDSCGACIIPALINEANLSIALCTDGTDYDSAESECSSRFSDHDLISVHSPQLEDEIEQVALAENAGDYWIGLDEESSPGAFSWVDGSAVDFTAFSPGEPDHFQNDEHCVNVRQDFGGWNDEPCFENHNYVCRIP